MGMFVYSDIQKAWGFVFSHSICGYKIGEMESMEQGCFVLIPEKEGDIVRIYDYGTSIGLVLKDSMGKVYGHEIVIEENIGEDCVIDTIGEAMYHTYRNFTDYRTFPDAMDDDVWKDSLIEAVKTYFDECFMKTDTAPYRNHLWLNSPLCKIAHGELAQNGKADKQAVIDMVRDMKDYIDEYGYFCVLRTIERILSEF